MKHSTKECIAAVTAFVLSVTVTYPGLVYLLFMWNSSPSDPAVVQAVVASVIISLMVIYALFQWVRRPLK